MFKKLQYLYGGVSTFPIFVIGIGRSGTHWLAECLDTHTEIRATIEVKPAWQWSVQMAVNQRLERKLYGRLAIFYKWQLFRSAPRLYLDKSQPNIWIAEKLKTTFPDVRFIGIERNPYAQVSSSIKHGAAQHRRHLRWREYPIPNRYYGITEDMTN